MDATHASISSTRAALAQTQEKSVGEHDDFSDTVLTIQRSYNISSAGLVRLEECHMVTYTALRDVSGIDTGEICSECDGSKHNQGP